ncbi:hypothetical protein SCOCK_280081 [Actinacidiphila cocklensis]|uniref:Uncharacterized protein n=1 Tax=Actinacidiphila cocklensis TaxID=887465 RepID=A0A9W4DRB0_9ACTN|nr:hypothetical protein SCOCK_280081 [Actinacidiphila cocklensis]
MGQVTSAAPVPAADALVQWLLQPVAGVAVRARSVAGRRAAGGPPSFGRCAAGLAEWAILRRYAGQSIVMEPCPEFLRPVANLEG